ncbi:hypothetical protein K505DRAFT_337834 [Melanomma pulvis-pyrius CBS 109.77]|uniref:Uncharacterized protein n=1 Tax=Melanomma pulvis-pyrius CBS 109.77 TaxID=1314802 RepID=A0A6A6XAJ7_9PLEO|nr:hypothetical protein K505DRAFT_337834 [Melanomma pulvis-pyrius CBS 109.77]
MAHYGCSLCGFVISSSASIDAELWLREYRASYPVTDVGWYDGSASWNVPLDPARRWDDDDSNLRLHELPVMRQPPLHGRHGFILHDACWMLLRRAWGLRGPYRAGHPKVFCVVGNLIPTPRGHLTFLGRRCKPLRRANHACHLVELCKTSTGPGTSVVTDSTSDVRIGYISSSETFFTLQELFIFKVAVAPSGLRALQIVGKNIRLDPSNELYLNENSFTGQNPCHTGYRPLLWNHFGGPRGSHLKNIVGLFVKSKYRFSSLEFVYDGICGHSSSTLGLCNEEGVHRDPMFTIDGIAGELITSVAVHVEKDEHSPIHDFLRHGLWKCFKITTNRGREFQSHVDCKHSEMQSLTIAARTTITGFYTSHSEGTNSPVPMGRTGTENTDKIMCVM